MQGFRGAIARLAAALAMLGGVLIMAARAEPDIDRIFNNQALIGMSDADLTQRKLKRFELGMLHVDTGEIVATDPLVQPERPPFNRKVAPGNYKVILYKLTGPDPRVALAELRLAPGVPVRWELALIAGQDITRLKYDEFYGYPVDAGTGSFFDKSAFKAVEAREAQERADGKYSSYYDDVLAEEYSGENEHHLMHVPVKGDPHNMAIIHSGWGDGYYPTFWGLDEKGEPLVLVTDFFVAENGDGRSRVDLNLEAAMKVTGKREREINVPASDALKANETATLRKFLEAGDLKPDTFSFDAGWSFMREAIRLDKPDVIEMFMEFGVTDKMPVHSMMDDMDTTYSGYFRSLQDMAAKTKQELGFDPPAPLSDRTAKLISELEKRTTKGKPEQ